jgi:D-glycero-alpha-D-manno-heptose 1-phosphate guanylyltransferase
MVKEAIVLAGGLGTRLRKVVKDVPKPMADVNGKPFLEYLLAFLAKQQIEKVVLSVGYKYEVIKNYFGKFFSGMELVYSVESEPLGTGGGIRKSLSFVNSGNVFIVNGDTFFDVNLKKLFLFHKKKKSVISVALKPMKHFDRYGSVKLDENKKIIGFEEKKYHESGLINGGIYLLNKDFFMSFDLGEKFSFEKDFLEKYYNSYAFYGLEFESYFIDIGIPEDYENFKKDVAKQIVIDLPHI